jgi:hypothetical protein
MEDLESKFAHIKGWGIDADPENDPTYPMKHWTGDDHNRLNYERATQQPATVEILHSNERPNLTAVFGTSTPPSGLSGQIRRFAFTRSEGEFSHWIPLILADRINMIEGIFDDLKRGHFPNFFAERGWNAEWKYNRKGFIQKAAIATAITAGVVVALSLRSKKKKKQVVI